MTIWEGGPAPPQRRQDPKEGDTVKVEYDEFSAKNLKPLSTIFLRMIKSLIAPLIFATLVVGIAGHGDDMKRVGRLAFKSLLYFEIVTTLALFIGLAAVNFTKPGVGVNLDAPAKEGAAARGDADDVRRFPRSTSSRTACSMRRSGTRCCRSSSGRSCSRLP